jgi:hypothetical protein
MIELPQEFLAYHQRGSITYGELNSVVIRCFELWPIADLEKMNDEYLVPEFAPDFFGIGTSGGGEMFAFDKDRQVVILPFIGMEARYARVVAPSWSVFERLISAQHGVPADLPRPVGSAGG